MCVACKIYVIRFYVLILVCIYSGTLCKHFYIFFTFVLIVSFLHLWKFNYLQISNEIKRATSISSKFISKSSYFRIFDLRLAFACITNHKLQFWFLLVAVLWRQSKLVWHESLLTGETNEAYKYACTQQWKSCKTKRLETLEFSDLNWTNLKSFGL